MNKILTTSFALVFTLALVTAIVVGLGFGGYGHDEGKETSEPAPKISGGKLWRPDPDTPNVNTDFDDITISSEGLISPKGMKPEPAPPTWDGDITSWIEPPSRGVYIHDGEGELSKVTEAKQLINLFEYLIENGEVENRAYIEMLLYHLKRIAGEE